MRHLGFPNQGRGDGRRRLWPKMVGVLAGVDLANFGQQLVDEDVRVAVDDELVDHVVEAVACAKAIDGGRKAGRS